MKTELYIISQNNVSKEFWELYIDKNSTNISKFKNVKSLIKKLDINEPSVLIIDDYFTHDNYLWITSVLDQITRSKYQFKLYYVSPKFAELNAPYLIKNSICKYPFNSDFISAINRDLNTIISLTA